ncbi:hypothetical protein PR048_002710 [Dryococelus australis]|uniref:Uncharacterized protein n=1 Tax=Dryococelus australis TaxID=614101 RepID=A0ABQ9IKZ4_9NEOP|nr:hypothetical protein PR048_002710 [Dryococelus australis]
MGDPRENSPTSGIVWHDSHLRKSGVTRPGTEPSSPWWEANSIIAQSPPPPSLFPELYRAESCTKKMDAKQIKVTKNCWERLRYGVAGGLPGQGLRAPRTVLVYPVVPGTPLVNFYVTPLPVKYTSYHNARQTTSAAYIKALVQPGLTSESLVAGRTQAARRLGSNPNLKQPQFINSKLSNARSLMPLDDLGLTRAALKESACPNLKRPGNSFSRLRARDCKKFLVNASHKPPLITSLPFVYTARRYYRLNDLVESGEIWASLNTEVLRTDGGGVRRVRINAVMQGGKWEIREKTRRPAASSGTIHTCEHPGATSRESNPDSPGWEASSLTSTPPRPLWDQ